jgi:hypothetical protein
MNYNINDLEQKLGTIRTRLRLCRLEGADHLVVLLSREACALEDEIHALRLGEKRS